MEENFDRKTAVEEIRKQIEISKGTLSWDNNVNALKVIAQSLFARSSSFILELIQNAEDSGLGLDYPGEFEIRINEKRMLVIHNGKPFNGNDVKDICRIGLKR